MPLRARLRGARLLHGPANALPLFSAGLLGIVTLHDLAIYEHPEWFPGRQWLSVRVIVPRSARRARFVIVPSEATQKAAVARFGLDPRRCRVIPHGVEPAFFKPLEPEKRAALREELRLPERFVLQVGTIQPRKNHLVSLRALAQLPESERIPLVLAGDFGWGFEPVLRAVSELGLESWVRFIGYVRPERLPGLYQLATAVLFPSLDEGFGLPVLEGFASGVPVVASSAGALPEVSQGAALECPPEDAGAFADALSRVLSEVSLRERLIASGRQRARLYSWEAAADAHRAVYRAALSGSRGET
jgi:alpha-1,3-rhamnosyl/mannosyltransferase